MNQEQSVWAQYPPRTGGPGMQVPATQFVHMLNGNEQLGGGQPAVMLAQDSAGGWMTPGLKGVSPKPAREYLMGNPHEGFMAAPPPASEGNEGNLSRNNNNIVYVSTPGAPNPVQQKPITEVPLTYDSFDTMVGKDGITYLVPMTNQPAPHGNIPGTPVPLVFVVQNSAENTNYSPNPSALVPLEGAYNGGGMYFAAGGTSGIPVTHKGHGYPHGGSSVESSGSFSQFPNGVRLTPSSHQDFPVSSSPSSMGGSVRVPRQKDPKTFNNRAATYIRPPPAASTYSGPQAWVNRAHIPISPDPNTSTMEGYRGIQRIGLFQLSSSFPPMIYFPPVRKLCQVNIEKIKSSSKKHKSAKEHIGSLGLCIHLRYPLDYFIPILAAHKVHYPNIQQCFQQNQTPCGYYFERCTPRLSFDTMKGDKWVKKTPKGDNEENIVIHISSVFLPTIFGFPLLKKKYFVFRKGDNILWKSIGNPNLNNPVDTSQQHWVMTPNRNREESLILLIQHIVGYQALFPPPSCQFLEQLAPLFLTFFYVCFGFLSHIYPRDQLFYLNKIDPKEKGLDLHRRYTGHSSAARQKKKEEMLPLLFFSSFTGSQASVLTGIIKTLKKSDSRVKRKVSYDSLSSSSGNSVELLQHHRSIFDPLVCLPQTSHKDIEPCFFFLFLPFQACDDVDLLSEPTSFFLPFLSVIVARLLKNTATGLIIFFLSEGEERVSVLESTNALHPSFLYTYINDKQ
eukprot:gene9356-6579_t